MTQTNADDIVKEPIETIADFPDMQTYLERVDAIIAKLQKETDKSKIPDLIDKLIDAQYLTFSMIDYTQHITDQQSDTSGSAHFNHFIAHTNKHPEDLAIMLISSLFAISIAISASRLVNNKKAQEAYIVGRQILSGLKNGRHAIVNLYLLLSPLIPTHYNIANPVGIAVGIALAPALITYSHFDAKRNKMIKHNEEIIAKLITNTEYNNATPESFSYQKPQNRGKLHNATMFGLALFDGLSDGAYMFGAIVQALGGYAGFAGLTAVTGGTAAIALLSVIAVYSVLSMISSLFVEYDRQKKLQKSVDEANIAQLNYLQEKARESDEYNKLSAQLKAQYKLEKSTDLLADLTTRFEKKYNIKYGETASRTRLTEDMNKFEESLIRLIPVTSKQQRLFNAFLSLERSTKNSYPELYTKKINMELLKDLNQELEGLRQQLGTKKNSNMMPTHPVTGISAYIPSIFKNEKTKELEKKIQALENKCKDVKTLITLKKLAGIDDNPLLENMLRYKTYCTELIASEKKLYKLWKLTGNTATARQEKINSELKERAMQCNPHNYYKRKQLNKELQEILAQKNAFNRVKSSKQKILTILRVNRLKVLSSLSIEHNNALDNIISKLNVSADNSIITLANIDHDQTLLALEMHYKIQPNETDQFDLFSKAIEKFDIIYKSQQDHLVDYSPRNPQTAGYLSAVWRAIRGFFSGFKNTNKIIDCTIKSPIMSGAGWVADKIAKSVLAPVVLAYSRYVAGKEQKRYTPKQRARGPRLFSSLHVEPDDFESSAATLNPV